MEYHVITRDVLIGDGEDPQEVLQDIVGGTGAVYRTVGQSPAGPTVEFHGDDVDLDEVLYRLSV